jgi:hypothetical protein
MLAIATLDRGTIVCYASEPDPGDPTHPLTPEPRFEKAVVVSRPPRGPAPGRVRIGYNYTL